MTPVFALTVSDAATDDMLEERIEIIEAASCRFSSMGAVRIRDDAMDAGMFKKAASMARALDLDIILESDVPGNLEAAFAYGSILSSPLGDQEELVRTAAGLGAVAMISSPETDELERLAAVAAGLGCGIILDPDARSMKGCHESVVRIGRTSTFDGIPVAIRAWSGEYALAVASVAIMDGASMVVLDDLDAQSCGVLDDLIRSGIRGPFRCRTADPDIYQP